MSKLTASPQLTALFQKMETFPNAYLTPPTLVSAEFLAQFVDGKCAVTFDFSNATCSENTAKTVANAGKLIPQIFPLSKAGDVSTMALRLSAADARKIVESGISNWIVSHTKNPSVDGKIFYDQFTAVSPVTANAPALNQPAAA